MPNHTYLLCIAAAFTLLIILGCSDGPQCETLCESDFWQSATEIDVHRELNSGADVNAKSREIPYPGGRNPLHYAAAYSNDPEIIRLLIRRGAEVNAEDNSGDSPLHLAVWQNENRGVVRALLENGADINAIGRDKKCCGLDIPPRGDTVLHLAARNDNPMIVQTLLDAGTDPNATNSWGHTPLYEAVDILGNNHPVSVRTLLEAGANPNIGKERIPMDAAARYASDPEVIYLLLEFGSRIPDLEINWGWGILGDAIRNDNSDVALLFVEGYIEMGLDVNTVNWRGNTLLHEAAAYCDHPEVAQLLIDSGADVNITNENGETPSHRAAELNQNPEFLEVLLDNDADLSAKDNNGNTPLHSAAGRDMGQARQSESHQFVEILLDAGAPKDSQNLAGLSACQVAEQNEALIGSMSFRRLCDM